MPHPHLVLIVLILAVADTFAPFQVSSPIFLLCFLNPQHNLLKLGLIIEDFPQI